MIGPSPRLVNLIGDQSRIRNTPIDNPHMQLMRMYLRTKDPTGKSLKMIYEEILTEPNLEENQIKEIQLLRKIKPSKLREIGLKTIHNAHPTRKWLHDRQFKLAKDGNCPKCNIEQSQYHIFNNCQLSEALRTHVKNKYLPEPYLHQISPAKPEISTLYQKIVIRITMEYNTTSNHIDGVDMFEKELTCMQLTPSHTP